MAVFLLSSCLEQRWNMFSLTVQADIAQLFGLIA